MGMQSCARQDNPDAGSPTRTQMQTADGFPGQLADASMVTRCQRSFSLSPYTPPQEEQSPCTPARRHPADAPVTSNGTSNDTGLEEFRKAVCAAAGSGAEAAAPSRSLGNSQGGSEAPREDALDIIAD